MGIAKTYRHRVTGLLGEYEDGLAQQFASVLELVEPDAKPLAYVPITVEAVEDIKSASHSLRKAK